MPARGKVCIFIYMYICRDQHRLTIGSFDTSPNIFGLSYIHIKTCMCDVQSRESCKFNHKLGKQYFDKSSSYSMVQYLYSAPIVLYYESDSEVYGMLPLA